METHHGDATGLSGAIILILSVVAEFFHDSIGWLDAHTGAVVALCAIGGFVLSWVSVIQRNRALKR